MAKSELIDFEIEVLASLAGRRPPMTWGSAIGQVTEILRGRGLARGFNATEAGLKYLDDIGYSSEKD